MVDYVRLQQTALRLVQANGRGIMLRGRGLPDISLFGAFVIPNSLSKDGLAALGTGTQFQDLIARSQEIIITAIENNDIIDHTVVHDPDGPIANGYWNITGIQLLRPGTINILAYIGVDR